MNRLLGVLAIILLIGLWNITVPELASDREILLLNAAQVFNAGGGGNLPLWLGHALDWLHSPLFLWLLQMAEQLLGPHLWVERMLSLLCAILVVVGVYGLGTALHKNRMGAFASAVVLATMGGFFRAEILDGPSMLLLALILPCLILALSLMTSSRRNLQPQALMLGVCLALVSLAGGLGALVFVLLLITTLGVSLKQHELLRRMPWRFLVIPFALLALPWPLLLIQRYGVLPVITTFALHAFRIDFSQTGMLFKHLVSQITSALWPYLLFVPACLMELRLFRKGGRGGPDPLPVLVLAWVILDILFSATLHPVMLLVPVALLVGGYFGSAMDTSASISTSGQTRSRFYALAVDLTVVMLMVQAVAMSVLFYQNLSDTYPAGAWHLPGPPTIKLLATFAVWKLWLAPLPVLLLAGGAVLYLLSASRRLQYTPFVLMATALLVMFYTRAFYWPVMQRNVVSSLAPVLQKQWHKGDALLIDRANPELTRVLTLLPTPIGQVRLFDDANGLIQALALAMTPPAAVSSNTTPSASMPSPHSNSAIWGLLPESVYYELDPDTRAHMQVMAAQNEWHGLDISAITGIGLFWQHPPETILLFRTLPFEAK